MTEYEKVMKEGGYSLLSKTVFKITEDVASLVSGLTTNILEAPRNAFLNKQGKLIALVDQLKVSDQEYYMVVEASFKEALKSHLGIYLPYSKAKMEETSLKTAHFIGIQPESGLIIPSSIGCFVLFENSDLLSNFSEIPREVYEVIRIENNISIQGREFQDPMILETNREDAVSYTKGCYLGQEIVARVHNLGKPKRKLVRILFDKVPDTITSGEKEIGEIHTSCFSPKFNKHLVFATIDNNDLPIDAGEILNKEESNG